MKATLSALIFLTASFFSAPAHATPQQSATATATPQTLAPSKIP